MTGPNTAVSRAEFFCQENGMRIPILLAPMAGACPTSLSIAVANAGGMAACGALMMAPEEISEWVSALRKGTNGAFQLNTWVPDPDPVRNLEHEEAVRSFLAGWGPRPDAVSSKSSLVVTDFPGQLNAMLKARPTAISSVMGLLPADFVTRMKAEKIKWYATITTVGEALAAQDAGADVIVAQGMEAGGHRGAFDANLAGCAPVGLFSLLPAVVDAVSVPVVAAGGIADARGISAALMLGASSVQIGTGFLRTPEAGIAPAWASAIGSARPEDTVATCAFSGRLGRSLRTAYTEAASGEDAPSPAVYPVQRILTQPMRQAAIDLDDLDGMQAWAGQSAGLARVEPAAELIFSLWDDAKEMLGRNT